MRRRDLDINIGRGSLAAMAMALLVGANAQLADLAQVVDRSPLHDGGVSDLASLLHDHDQHIEFIENRGQFRSEVLFKADFPLGQALATKEGMLMKTYDPRAVQERQEEGMRIEKEMHDGKPARPLRWQERGHGWMMHFRNSLPSMRIESREQHEDVTNYFTGGKEAIGVHSYQEVWYTGVYRGVDVRYYPAADGSLEYDIICAPGSDIGKIAIELKGITGARVNAKGELVLPTILGDQVYPAPVVYQRIAGREKRIDASYAMSEGKVLGFTIGKYDHTQPLVIDPIALRWATWVNTNSSGDNHGHAIWVDPNDGAVYVVARVVGTTDNITVGAFDMSANGNLETIVGKYLEPANVGGSGTRVWQTYIGGGQDDNPYAMEQGPDGNLYITGQTASTDFPLSGGSAFTGSGIDQRAQSGINVFVLKINPAGNSIKAAVVGGNGSDDNFDVRTAANGDVLVCGSTTSTNLLTLNAGSGASNTNNGGSDVFLFRINQDLNSLAWLRNYGGSGDDRASIMLYNSATNDLFVGGNTSSTNFPTVSPRQSTRGGTTAGFIQRLTGAGVTTWSSYFSSSTNNDANLLCMEFNTNKDQLFFGGVTEGLNAANITSGVYDATHNGSNDFYVARMGIDQTFIAGTYVGGSGNEVNMMGLNTDQNNDVYVFGYTNSTNFPVSVSPNVPLQTTNQGNNDKVFFKLKNDLTALNFSTYYGGTADDYDPVGERGIKFSNCRIYTIITAQSNNIPLTQGALNTTKTSTTSRYEPGLVVWANPPDLLGNTINYQGTAICAGTVPSDILGSQPNYTLPTIVRNNTNSSYPAFPSAATYQWQVSLDSLNWTDISGATGQNLLGSQIGVVNQTTYIRRIIGGDACILSGAADQVVTVRIMSVIGDLTQPLCNGDATGSIMAIADGLAPFTYAWSNGQSGQTATGLIAGGYSVTVTDANGCQASNQFVLGQPTALGGTASVTPATCGNANGSATASGNGGTPGYTYLWSTNTPGATLSGVPAGDYSVTITDGHGCTYVLNVNIPGSGNVTANAGDDALITCLNNGQVVLHGSGTPGVSFSWSGPGIVSGGGSADVTVNAAGTYTLTVTDQQSGCSDTDQAQVTMNTAAPGAQADGGTITCTEQSVMLSGSGNGSFSWTGPNNFTSNDQNPTVSVAGTYTLTVTGQNGCTSTDQAQVGLDTEAPGAQATGGTITCMDPSVMLQSAGNGSFDWSGPNNFSSNQQSPTVSVAGTYVLTVTGNNGCTSTANAEVGLDTEAPGAQAVGGLRDCNNASVMLQGSGNGSFSWSGPNNFSSNDQNPTVSVDGTYVLTVTGANGCTSTANAEVSSDFHTPTAFVGFFLQPNCINATTNLTGNSDEPNVSFAWSGPNNFSSNDQTITVSVAGTYTLTVTGQNGCTGTATAVVNPDVAIPTAIAFGGTITCAENSVMLQAFGNGSFSWSGPGNFNSTEQFPVVNVAGTYVLTVTGENGCSNTAQAVVDQDNSVPGAQALGGTITCTNTSVMLQGSGNGSFSWNGPNGYTSTDQNPTVSVAGTYVLTVTGENGCSSTANAEVGLDNEGPGAQAAGGMLDCNNASVMLQGVGNGSFSWTGPNNFSSTDQNPTVSVVGTYVLTVTGANGCTSTANAEVSSDFHTPAAFVGFFFQPNCINATTSLMGNSDEPNVSFAWSGPNNFSSNDQTITVSVAGTYTLTVTGANGCSGLSTAVVNPDVAIPTAIAFGGTITCDSTSVMLQAFGNGSFSWSGPGNFNSTEQFPVVNVAGTYVLTVTGENGCTNTAQAVVDQDNSVPGAQALGGTITCTNTSVMLQGSGNGSFSWTGPNGYTSNDQNPTVSVAGTYVLTVTGENGCSSTANAEVGQDNESPGAQAAGGMLDCNNANVMLQGVGNGSFNWSGPNNFSSNDQNPTVSVAGTYVLTVTGANGCTSTANAEVSSDFHTPTAFVGFFFQPNCINATTNLTGNSDEPNVSFAWSGPNNFSSNDQSITVSAAGTYTLTVTGANGCTGSATAVVAPDTAIPTAIAFGGTVTCAENNVALQGFGNGSFSWSGPNNFSSALQFPVVTVAGTYVLTVTAENGCINTAQAVVDIDTNVPGILAEGGVLPCDNSGLMLNASISGAASFSWSGPNGFTSADEDPLVFVAGMYTLTAVGENGCTSIAEATVLVGDCGKQCPPVIIDCPQPMTVECGTNLEPDFIGYPVYRKDKDCPPIVYATYYDVTTGVCPRIMTRYWTMADNTGDTARCEQLFIIVDTQAPVIVGVPADVQVECGEVPAKEPDVWAEDACKSWFNVEVTETQTPGECAGSYVIHRTYWAVDDCGNLGTATQVITVIDNTPPELVGDIEPEVKADCNKIPAATECKAIDGCDDDVRVEVYDEMTKSEEWKGCVMLRHYTATDDCGNATEFVQTIWLAGDCCKADKESGSTGALMVSISPNPFREECRIAFTPLASGRASLDIYDANGRPVANAFNAFVAEGQDVQVIFHAGSLQRGIYQYHLVTAAGEARGRMVVQ